jgi:6-phosphogluconolactonase (cycloisomerase 2 family)
MTAAPDPSMTDARSTAEAQQAGVRPANRAVFVQTADPDGNAVVAHHRLDDGTLTLTARYPTGGRGGALGGAVADHLASQSSLAYDEDRGLLYAVDSGSDTLVVFPVDAGDLDRPRRLPSGGRFPVSVALHGDLVYVLNGREGGSLQGFRHDGDGLTAIDGSRRELGLDTTTMPEFTHTPGQVGFSPAGRHLVVTTKADNGILVFALDDAGRPAAGPQRYERPAAVPFGFTFSPAGHLVVAEAGTSALSSFMMATDGSLTMLANMGTGQAATCWVSHRDDLLFASNAGSSTVTTMRIDELGHLSLLATTPVSPGTVDSAVSADGRFLYVQAGGAGVVDELAINADGTLTLLGSLPVEGAKGGEGIVAR